VQPNNEIDDAHATRTVPSSTPSGPIALSADRAPLASLRAADPAATLTSRATTMAPAPRARRDQASGRPAFARLDVMPSLDEAEGPWRRLESLAPVSPYQTFAWTKAWMETQGRESGIRPLIAVASDDRGQVVALMPLGLARRGWLDVAGFLGGRHANYNLGLFDPAVEWTEADVRRLLRDIAAGRRIDVFAFVNQPREWDGWRNPLIHLRHQASPSDSHRATLQADGEAFLAAHLSTATRKKQRNKALRLGALGGATPFKGHSRAEIDAILDAYVEQKASKLAAIGAGVDEEGLASQRRLLAYAATEGSPPVLEVHGLRCGDRIVATFGGLTHRGRFSGMLISHDDDPDIARFSPGEILLAAVIKAKCAEGYASFDLGIGEARYKESLCPIVDPLIDSLLPVSLPGRLFVAGEAIRLRLKRAIKQSRWAWPLALAARRRLAAVRSAPPAG
jgi:CelD/BcsL family acetyltransferase involved in cellulose biosynthesis